MLVFWKQILNLCRLILFSFAALWHLIFIKSNWTDGRKGLCLSFSLLQYICLNITALFVDYELHRIRGLKKEPRVHFKSKLHKWGTSIVLNSSFHSTLPSNTYSLFSTLILHFRNSTIWGIFDLILPSS